MAPRATPARPRRRSGVRRAKPLTAPRKGRHGGDEPPVDDPEGAFGGEAPRAESATTRTHPPRGAGIVPRPTTAPAHLGFDWIADRPATGLAGCGRPIEAMGSR